MAKTDCTIALILSCFRVLGNKIQAIGPVKIAHFLSSDGLLQQRFTPDAARCVKNDLLESLNLHTDWESDILMYVNDKMEGDCGRVLSISAASKSKLLFYFVG